MALAQEHSAELMPLAQQYGPQAIELIYPAHFQEHGPAVAEHLQNHGPVKPVSDEEIEEAKGAHKEFYHEDGRPRAPQDGREPNPDRVAAAAVTQAMHEAKRHPPPHSPGGGFDMNALMPMVMSQATGLLGALEAQPELKAAVMQKVGTMVFKTQAKAPETEGGLGSVMKMFLH
ncbi:hypothetical protein K438DRAFT_621155 [Mycena galopus ATCC 62051]|nr:hypothetical protein K438DRAFT_621155 [Mycena galopus ATCC 62051]